MNKTYTASNPTGPATNGSAQRKNRSWIESFIDYTENLESPLMFRKWAAITAIAAAVEQRVFVHTSSRLYPNLYTILIGPPGVGKTKSIKGVGHFIRQLEDFNTAPTSLTAASLVDALSEAVCRKVRHHDNLPVLEFNSMFLMADELSSFMHEYDKALIGNLTTFYDADVPYTHTRRTGAINIHIQAPQLSLLVGSTTSNFMKTIPEAAWDQGFMSRVIMIFGDDKIINDDIFEVPEGPGEKELAHDLNIINNLQGQFAVSDEYRDLLNSWRKGGNLPTPSHPRLVHYTTRRTAHLLKLSMVSSIDRSDSLRLEAKDFERSLAWLVEAEKLMVYVFASQTTTDSRVMDEIAHFCQTEQGETKLVRFTAERVASHSVMKVIDLMVGAGMLKVVKADAKGLRTFRS